MDNTQQIQKAHDENARNLKLWTAATDLESATHLARTARTKLQRATAARLSWKERHDDAKRLHGLAEAEDSAASWNRVECPRHGASEAVVDAAVDAAEAVLSSVPGLPRIARPQLRRLVLAALPVVVQAIGTGALDHLLPAPGAGSGNGPGTGGGTGAGDGSGGANPEPAP